MLAKDGGAETMSATPGAGWKGRPMAPGTEPGADSDVHAHEAAGRRWGCRWSFSESCALTGAPGTGRTVP